MVYRLLWNEETLWKESLFHIFSILIVNILLKWKWLQCIYTSYERCWNTLCLWNSLWCILIYYSLTANTPTRFLIKYRSIKSQSQVGQQWTWVMAPFFVGTVYARSLHSLSQNCRGKDLYSKHLCSVSRGYSGWHCCHFSLVRIAAERPR